MTKPIEELIRPVGQNLYIIMEERAGKMGTIEMPSSYQQRSEIAVVKAIGDEVEKIAVGDRVLISYSSGTHVQLPETYTESSKHRIIIEHEILARLEE